MFEKESKRMYSSVSVANIAFFDIMSFRSLTSLNLAIIDAVNADIFFA